MQIIRRSNEWGVSGSRWFDVIVEVDIKASHSVFIGKFQPPGSDDTE